MDKVVVFCYGIIAGMILMMLVCIVLISHFEHQPQAIDVYHGKTTLEYKVIDGVKTDSTVVWKN